MQIQNCMKQKVYKLNCALVYDKMGKKKRIDSKSKNRSIITKYRPNPSPILVPLEETFSQTQWDKHREGDQRLLQQGRRDGGREDYRWKCRVPHKMMGEYNNRHSRYLRSRMEVKRSKNIYEEREEVLDRRSRARHRRGG